MRLANNGTVGTKRVPDFLAEASDVSSFIHGDMYVTWNLYGSVLLLGGNAKPRELREEMSCTEHFVRAK
jgi:hypothetical protein